jgi:hypothetical protein
VLTSLSSLTKSALQITLQTTIIMITWSKDTLPSHIYQMASVSFSLLTLAKSCADHHYFEVSGKDITGKKQYSKEIGFVCLFVVFFSPHPTWPENQASTVQPRSDSYQRFYHCIAWWLPAVLHTFVHFHYGHC